MFKKICFLSCLCLLGFAISAKADPIGPTGCVNNSCLGSQYTLTFAPTSNPDVFDIFLKIDTSATTLPGDFLNAVAPKVSSSFNSVSLISGPPTFTGNPISGGLSANGCNGAGSGFFCSGSSSVTGVPVGSGDVYMWEWAIFVNSPSDLFTAAGEASIKTLFVDANGKQAGITSEPITLQSSVPEPGSLLLVCTGLMGAAVSVRRRFSR